MNWRITYFLFGAIAASYVFIEDIQIKERHEEVIKLTVRNTKNIIPEHVTIIKPDDRYKIIDCYAGATSIRSHKFMEMFSGKIDPLNAFYKVNSEDYLYTYIEGLDSLTQEDIILLGYRGINLGPPSSMLTYYLHEMNKEYQNTVVFMPGNFIKQGDKMRSVCHKKYYGSRYIGASWPGMNKDNSWEYINYVLPEKNNIYVFSYSNGSIVRDDLIRTKGYNPKSLWSISISDAIDFAKEYDEHTEFTRPEKLDRISGIIDIETNYEGGKAPWNLSKFLKEKVNNDPKKMYYQACSLDSGVAINMVLLINTLGMIGVENYDGVIRYQNRLRNIIIDIVTIDGPAPYYWGAVNLLTQTNFLPDLRKRHRLKLSHYEILPYAIESFKDIALKGNILKTYRNDNE